MEGKEGGIGKGRGRRGEESEKREARESDKDILLLY